MSETLAVLLVSVALLVALELHDRPTGPSRPWLGVLVGLGRADAQRAGAARRRRSPGWRGGGRAPRRRRGARRLLPVRCAAGGLAADRRAVARRTTSCRFERPVLLSTNDGTTLLGANCAQTYYVDVGGWDIRCLEPVPNDDTVDASVRSAAAPRRSPSTTSRDHLGAGAGRRRRPGRAHRSTSTACARSSPSTAARRRPSGRCGRASWLVGAGAAGRRRLARPRAGRRTVASGGGCSPCPATVLVTTILFYGAHRIRAPAEPAVVVLAAVGRRPCVGRSRRCDDSRRRRPGVARRQARRSCEDELRDARAGRRRVQRRRRLGVPRRRRPPHARAPSAVHAVTAVSPSLAGAERDDCAALGRRVGPALDAGRRPTRWRGPRTASTTSTAATTARPS